MNWIKRLFYDEIQADYLFDNGFHFKSFTEISWIRKGVSNDTIVKQETDWLKRKNSTSCMRIRKNGKQIWE